MNENNWRDERLDNLEQNDKEKDKRLRELENFKHSAIEKFKAIFERLQDIEKTNKWASQSFFYIIFSGVITAIFSLIVWIIQG